MAKIAEKLTDLIGNTPLLRLNNYSAACQLNCTLLAKLEACNPAGSAKDRIALAMIRDAEASGKLQPGAVIIEPTSGNTGIGLACVAASRGYRVILTMPDSMSVERRRLLQAYSARLVLTPGAAGMQGAIDKARELARSIPGALIPGQFDNPANPRSHYLTTGPEIWRDTAGRVDAFVAGVGSGGTVSGVGKYLKERNPQIKIVAVEPADSPILNGGKPGPHQIQGIGANFVPQNYDASVVDQVVDVSAADAFSSCRRLAATEGVLAGISAGAALFAATELARAAHCTGKNIVVLLPDTGERYLSTPGYLAETY